MFDPRPAVEWKNRYADFRSTEQDWRGENPQGGSVISVYSKAERGPGKLETSVVVLADIWMGAPQ